LDRSQERITNERDGLGWPVTFPEFLSWESKILPTIETQESTLACNQLMDIVRKKWKECHDHPCKGSFRIMTSHVVMSS
jgi:hypothetical protein